MIMRLDMHFHSTFSDWKNTMQDLVKAWKNKWLEFMALTDHDVLSWTDFESIVRENSIKTTRSVEISAYNEEDDRSLHLASYAWEFWDRILWLLEESRIWHKLLITTQIQKFKEKWFDIDEVELFAYFESMWTNIDNLNKFSIAEFLYTNSSNVDKIRAIYGQDISLRDFYNNFLKNGWKFYPEYLVIVPNYEIEVETCCDIKSQVDWILSIVHPNFTFKKWISEFEASLPMYIDKWVNAIEINTKASIDWVRAILKAKDRYWLYLTFWSDCHELWCVDDKHNDLWDLNPFLDYDFVKSEFEKYQDKIVIWNLIDN